MWLSFFRIAAALAGIIFFFNAGWAARLLIIEDGTERLLLCLPLEESRSFHIESMNSIYQAPVKETLVYEEGSGLFVVRVESPSPGVFEYYGLTPGGANGAGIARLHRPVPEMRIRSHDYRYHLLTVGDRKIRLQDFVADGEAVTVRATSGDTCGPR